MYNNDFYITVGGIMQNRRTFIRETASAGIAAILSSKVAPAFSKERMARTGITLEEAWDVHRRCLIVDGHQDTSVRRFARGEDPKSWMKRLQAS